MKVASINASLLKKMFLAGAMTLDAKKEWINELNVFPVPDGDTGTNMSMTIMSAAKELQALEDDDIKSISKAISSGSLRGARGNSGVILSQLFRGFTKEISGYDKLDSFVLASACERAVETAYKAVIKPKEGTILTVAKSMALKAVEVAPDTPDIKDFVGIVLGEGKKTLDRTPDMLPVLKQAGVVDSGGQGLIVILEAVYDILCDKPFDLLKIEVPEGKVSGITRISEETEDEIKYGYCTEYIIVLKNPMSDDDILRYKGFLESIGDSIVVVADDDIVKTHVHTNDPGIAMTEALKHGSLSRIKVDNMREEHEERLIKDASKIAAREKAKKELDKVPAEPRKEVGYISISAGEGLSDIFMSLGCDMIIEGGQTMNPATEDILAAINHVNAENIFLFPNNKNIIMAANQAAGLAVDKNVMVIPTKTIPQGITALINMVESASVEERRDQMLSDMNTVKTGQVTYAVRDTMIDTFDIKKGNYMGIGDSGILAVGEDLETVVKQSVEALVDDESGLISLYFGDGVTEDTANALGEEIAAKYEDVDMQVANGGQPVYSYIISVE